MIVHVAQVRTSVGLLQHERSILPVPAGKKIRALWKGSTGIRSAAASYPAR